MLVIMMKKHLEKNLGGHCVREKSVVISVFGPNYYVRKMLFHLRFCSDPLSKDN